MTPGLASALDHVRHRIDRACLAAGRDRDEVRLVAVSKTFPAEQVVALMGHGHDLFGENRVQEALDKIPCVGGGARWHLIGHLQRNKVRHVVGRFELIHGVDSAALAQELDRRCGAAGLTQAVLLQVNLSLEPTKAGVREEELPALIERVAGLPHLDLRGLMTLPPPVERPEDSRRWFARLRALREQARAWAGRSLPELSMGMTDDFEVAIEEGATLIRVGRAIFGARPTDSEVE